MGTWLALLVLATPALLSPWLGLIAVIGLGVVTRILYRNSWKISGHFCALLALVQIGGIWSHYEIPRWRVWARNLPGEIQPGSSEGDVARIAGKRAIIPSRGKYGFNGDRHLDIAPRGLSSAWGDYWRLILYMDKAGKVARIEVKQIEP